MGYFANDYGWTQLAIEDGGKEPSPARLRDLIDTCRAYNVNTILVQKEFATQNAEIIAKEIGAKLVTINPLSYKWEQELRNIINNIAHE